MVHRAEGDTIDVELAHEYVEGEQPIVPLLMLRTPRTSAQELQELHCALAKVDRLPRSMSSLTAFSSAPIISPLHRSTSCSGSLGSPRKAQSCKSLKPVESRFVEDAPCDRCFDLVFDADGREVRAHICMQPLGASFSAELSGAAKVSEVRPNSHAQDLGIERGWILKSIASQDVSGSTFQEVYTLLRKNLDELPIYFNL
jgi:hypothetical protein